MDFKAIYQSEHWKSKILFTCRAVLKCVPSAIARWLKLFEKVLCRNVHTRTIKDITNPFWKNSHTVGLNGWNYIIKKNTV